MESVSHAGLNSSHMYHKKAIRPLPQRIVVVYVLTRKDFGGVRVGCDENVRVKTPNGPPPPARAKILGRRHHQQSQKGCVLRCHRDD
jgi:hypothetical protein